MAKLLYKPSCALYWNPEFFNMSFNKVLRKWLLIEFESAYDATEKANGREVSATFCLTWCHLSETRFECSEGTMTLWVEPEDQHKYSAMRKNVPRSEDKWWAVFLIARNFEAKFNVFQLSSSISKTHTGAWLDITERDYMRQHLPSKKLTS